MEGISGCFILLLLVLAGLGVWWWSSSQHRTSSTRAENSSRIPEEKLQPQGNEPRSDPREERPHGL